MTGQYFDKQLTQPKCLEFDKRLRHSLDQQKRQDNYIIYICWLGFFPSIGIEMELKLKMLEANANAKQVQVRPKETSFLSLE